MKKIRVVYFSQTKDEPEVIEMNQDFREFQLLLDGLIESVNPEDYNNFDERIRGLTIWVNEEGRVLKGFVPNIILNSDYKEEALLNWSILVGDLVVTDSDEEGNFESISEERIEPLIECLKEMRRELERELI